MKFIKEEADMERKDIRGFTVKVSFAFIWRRKCIAENASVRKELDSW